MYKYVRVDKRLVKTEIDPPLAYLFHLDKNNPFEYPIALYFGQFNEKYLKSVTLVYENNDKIFKEIEETKFIDQRIILKETLIKEINDLSYEIFPNRIIITTPLFVLLSDMKNDDILKMYYSNKLLKIDFGKGIGYFRITNKTCDPF